MVFGGANLRVETPGVGAAHGSQSIQCLSEVPLSPFSTDC
jgi:hypothetical protein